jgi:hypothetical protein
VRLQVGVVEYVGKCGLKAHSYSVGNVEDFGKTEAGCGCAWSLEDTDSGVAKSSGTRGRGRERRQIEVV